MATNAMVPLYSATLASPVLSVTISPIPGNYRDLRLVVAATNATGATATDPYFRINSDSSANYSRVKINGSGSSSSSTSTASDSVIYYDAWSTSMPALVTFDFLDYAQTDKHKTMLIRGNADGTANAQVGRWASMNAMTSITIYCTDQMGGGTPDSFAAGSTFSLYGIQA